MNDVWTNMYGGRKCLKAFLMCGECTYMHIRLVPEGPVPLRPMLEYKSRKLNKAARARSRVKYYESLENRGFKLMRSLHGNWNHNHLQELRERVWKLTALQKSGELRSDRPVQQAAPPAPGQLMQKFCVVARRHMSGQAVRTWSAKHERPGSFAGRS